MPFLFQKLAWPHGVKQIHLFLDDCSVFAFLFPFLLFFFFGLLITSYSIIAIINHDKLMHRDDHYPIVVFLLAIATLEKEKKQGVEKIKV